MGALSTYSNSKCVIDQWFNDWLSSDVLSLTNLNTAFCNQFRANYLTQHHGQSFVSKKFTCLKVKSYPTRHKRVRFFGGLFEYYRHIMICEIILPEIFERDIRIIVSASKHLEILRVGGVYTKNLVSVGHFTDKLLLTIKSCNKKVKEISIQATKVDFSMNSIDKLMTFCLYLCHLVLIQNYTVVFGYSSIVCKFHTGRYPVDIASALTHLQLSAELFQSHPLQESIWINTLSLFTNLCFVCLREVQVTALFLNELSKCGVRSLRQLHLDNCGSDYSASDIMHLFDLNFVLKLVLMKGNLGICAAVFPSTEFKSEDNHDGYTLVALSYTSFVMMAHQSEPCNCCNGSMQKIKL